MREEAQEWTYRKGTNVAQLSATLSGVNETLVGRLSTVLEVSREDARTVGFHATFLAACAVEGLAEALGQPVQFGPSIMRLVAAHEVDSENWDYFHPVDLLCEIDGETFTLLLLLPKSELQSLLPSARGSADLPDMEALGDLLRQLADQLSAEAQRSGIRPVRFSLPGSGVAPHNAEESLLRVQHTVSVGTPGLDTEFTVIHFVPVAALNSLAAESTDAGAPAQSPQQAYGPRPSAPPPAAAPAAPPAGTRRGTMEDTMGSGTSAQSGQVSGTSIHPVQFEAFAGDQEVRGGTNLDLLMDVSLRVSVELGRTDLTIKDVLDLGPGSVVELDKLAGEPVDILVNERLIAKGEVVVVDENFGVRVTDIVSPQKRIGRIR